MPATFYHHYSHYYGDPNLKKWRELCSKDKANNISELWSLVGKNKMPRVAEIGCGDGAIIEELGKHGFGCSFTGFEISESALAMACERNYLRPTQFILFDGVSLPVKNKKFDLAILSHVLEHVEEPRRLLEAASRIANNIFIEVPLELNARTPRNFSLTAVGHINIFNTVIIRYLVQSIGLRVLGERVSCPNRAIFIFQRSSFFGNIHWAIKASFLKIWPKMASHIFTYHGCLIAEASED